MRTITVAVPVDASELLDHRVRETSRGLTDSPPWTPPVWLYDERGSQIFEAITRLPEYYLTQAERSILAVHAAEIAELTGADTLVELGSGTSEKTTLLLDALEPDLYVPFDVSEPTLRSAVAATAAGRPSMDVHAVVGDFLHHLGEIPFGGRRLVAFLGGTIGNLEPAQRRRFLLDVDASLGFSDWFLLGSDLIKVPSRLISAYDDPAGVTAEFNRNVLRAMNRELGANFDPDGYDHAVHWDNEKAWIEMRLVARTPQCVRIELLDLELRFQDGEWLRTEISAKFTAEQVRKELGAAGFVTEHQWTDETGDFLVTLARPYC